MSRSPQEKCFDIYFAFCHVLFPEMRKVFGCSRVKCFRLTIVSEYDQEIPQSQTADNPVALRGRAAQPSRDTRKTN